MLEVVERPSTARNAAKALGQPQNALLAGGTLVMPDINAGTSGVTRLISLDSAGMSGIKVAAGKATIGAMTRLSEVGRSRQLAFLKPVIQAIGSPTLRNSATAGGNLFAPAPYGDFAVALLALDAALTVETATSRKTVKLEAWLKVKHPPGEIVTAVSFAVPKASAFRFHKAMRRAHNSASIATVAAVFDLAGGTVKQARIALGGVAPTPIRSPSAEAVLMGRKLSEAALEAGEAARKDIKPADDAYASAWYRREVLPVHIRRALTGA